MNSITSAQFLLTFVVGVLLPILNGLVTRYGATRTRVYLGIALSAANGFLMEAVAGGPGFDWLGVGIGAAVSLVTALAIEAKVWAPLGVSDKVKRSGVGAATVEGTVLGVRDEEYPRG